MRTKKAQQKQQHKQNKVVTTCIFKPSGSVKNKIVLFFNLDITLWIQLQDVECQAATSP